MPDGVDDLVERLELGNDALRLLGHGQGRGDGEPEGGEDEDRSAHEDLLGYDEPHYIAPAIGISSWDSPLRVIDEDAPG